MWVNKVLLAVNLETLAVRELYRAPAEFTTTMTNVTSDGRYVCTGLYEDLSGRFRVNLDHGYIGFKEYWEANPLSRVLRISAVHSATTKRAVRPARTRFRRVRSFIRQRW
jgi:oligogalacturonide lyase